MKLTSDDLLNFRTKLEYNFNRAINFSSCPRQFTLTILREVIAHFPDNLFFFRVILLKSKASESTQHLLKFPLYPFQVLVLDQP